MAKITNTGGAVKKNPLAKFTKSIGTQRLIALLALIILYLVFGFINPAFRSYATPVSYTHLQDGNGRRCGLSSIWTGLCWARKSALRTENTR